MKLDEISEKLQEAYSRDDIELAAKLFADAKEMGIDMVSIYQDLEMSYHYVQTHQDVSIKGYAISPHSHTFAELLLCRSSCGVEYLLGSERFQLQRGDILVIPIGVSHCPLMSGVTEPYRRDVLWVSAAFLEFLSQLYPELQPMPSHLIRTAGTRWDYLCELFHNGVLEAVRKEPGWEAAVIGNTMQLLVHLNRAGRDRHVVVRQAEKTELLDQVVAYIKENLARKITLADTARRFYVSESTISHTFQEQMGVSFYRCVTQHRLIAAKEHILRGEPLENVSRTVGFGNYSVFYRAFRQEYGVSPRDFGKLSVPKGLSG